MINFDALTANTSSFDLAKPTPISDAERDYFRFYRINFEENHSHINHHFGHIRCGDFDIAAHYYENPQAVKTCFIVHGFFDHAGLYGHVIDYCLIKNFSVVIFDLPGHGLSSGERASIGSFQDYQNVLSDLLLFFKNKAPAPWCAIGQSTGGAILMDFLLSDEQQMFEKTVLLAPLVRPTGWPVAKLIHTVAKPWISSINRRFADNSNNYSFQSFIKHHDPLQATRMPLRWVSALKPWINYFVSKQPVSAKPLVIQGEADATVDWRFNIKIIQQKFPDSKLCYLEAAKHHLVNEREDIRQSMYTAMDIYFDADGS